MDKILSITLTIVIMASVAPTAFAQEAEKGALWTFTYQWEAGTGTKFGETCWVSTENPRIVKYTTRDNRSILYGLPEFAKDNSIAGTISGGDITLTPDLSDGGNGTTAKGNINIEAGSGSGTWTQKKKDTFPYGEVVYDCSGTWKAEAAGQPVATLDDDELSEEDFEISDLKPNTYEVIKLDGLPNVIKFVDIYGKEQYTTDGKHYYSSYGKAVKPGIKGLINKAKDILGNFKDFFFKTKYKDKDKQLRNDIAREVLKDFKSQKEKKLDKIHGKYVKKIGNAPGLLGKYASVSADAIIKFNNEASEIDFAQGAEYYFQEREGGRSSEHIYDTPPEEIEYGVGALTHDKYPKAVLYTKYEEAYQKYKLAKQLGRK